MSPNSTHHGAQLDGLCGASPGFRDRGRGAAGRIDGVRILIAGAFPEVPDRPRGGEEAVVWELARHLARLDDTDVHLASAEGQAPRLPRRMDGVTVHDARPQRRLPGGLGAATEGFSIRQLAQYLRPDVVHGFGHGGNGVGAVASGLPHLLSPRELPATRAATLPLRTAAHVAVVSPRVRASVAPLVRGHLHELAPPVAPEFFDVIRASRPASAPTLVAVGAMVPRKRHDLAIRALAVARREVPDVRLRIAGHVGRSGRPLLSELRTLAGRLGVADAVDFLGGVSQGQLLREYAEADLLLHTAADATSPLAITQAMAAGLPVVAVDIPGVHHLVRDGVTGLRAGPATPRGVAGAVVRLLEDPETAAALALTARDRAHREFEPLGVARRTRALYARIASS